MDPQTKILYKILDQDPPERFKPINEILDEDPPERFKIILSDLNNPIKRAKAESLFNLCKETNLNTVVDILRYLLEDIDVRKMSATLLEKIFEKSESTRLRVVNKLVNLLQHSLVDVREMSATLLGNIFKKSKLTPSPVIISFLLDCVVKKENRPIIGVFGDTISKLAPDEKVANTLLEGLARDNTILQECTLLIFPQLVQYVFDSKVLYMTRLRNVFMNCLGNLGSANVRIAALIAATSFIQRLVIYENSFQDLLPRMMQCLDESVNGGDEAMKQKALVLLIELAETKPSFFKEHLVEVVGSMLQIAYTLEEGTGNLAIKFVITLVQYVINRELVDYMTRLHIVFKRCLEKVGVGSANVRVAAVIAATSFIQWLMRHGHGDMFQDLLPGMMQCLDELLNGGDEWMKQKVLVLLIKLADKKPRVFTERLVEVLWSMLQIAEAESLEERTRDLAIDFVIRLEEVSKGPAHIHVRAMSAFLLGNLLKQCHPMSESTQLLAKGYLQDCVDHEDHKPIIEILGYPISMLAPDEDFAYFIENRVASLQESALLVFPHVVQYVMACNGPLTIRLRCVFKNHLENAGSANVRIAVLIAVTSFIQCLMSSSDGDWFEDLLPGMMQCLDEVLNGGDEVMTQKALVLLIELAEKEPSFFTERLVEVVGSMSQIAEAENLEEGTKCLANKFASTLEKAHAVSPVVNISDNFPPDTSMPDMLEIVGNLPQFRLQEGIASDQTRTPAIEKLLRQFEEKLPPNTWASRWSSLRLKSILAQIHSGT